MYRIITSSKDTYITNKIIKNKFRATDANVGQAGTLDLFKLYAENTSGSNTAPTELSRILIKFDFDQIKKMHNEKKINVGDSSFKSYLKLFDVYGGQTTPNNFKIIAFPLSKSFDEGNGYDIVNFSDLDATNFITASFPGTASPSAATASLTVASAGSANGMAEKEFITITSFNSITKKYVIVDSANTSVSTGDILALDSDTGGSTAGSGNIGAIAVAINLSSATQNDFIVALKSAIENANGHSGNITVSAVSGGAITLTQASTGYSGNVSMSSDISQITIDQFAGGTGGPQLWTLPGAMQSGSLFDSIKNIDVFVSGVIPGEGDTALNLSSEQYFKEGTENLNLDVTKFVSASSQGIIPNNGFVIAFSGSYETDQKTYFVKRFASRDASNKALRPQLTIQFDDSIQDNHSNFEFDLTGSLYLNNIHRGSFSNIKSGLAAAEVTGANCMILKIQTGSFEKQFNVSQVPRGSGRLTGIYSASLAISSFDSSLYDHVLASGSITFDEIWSNSTETITFLSSSLKIEKNKISAVSYSEQRLNVSILNLKQRYKKDENARIRVYAQNADRDIVLVKKPIETPSEIFQNMFYRVRDVNNGKIIIPFDDNNGSTKLSSDAKGMYFDFFMDSLSTGRTYSFDFLIKQQGFEQVIKDAASKFIIE